METVVVSSSRSSHGNTMRLAEVFAQTLDARVITPDELTVEVLAGADRIGFGSGIYFMDVDRRLKSCIDALPPMHGRPVFVFATSGFPEPPFRRYTKRVSRRLEDRGCRVTGVFTCRGIDTWGPFGLVGGVSRGRPDADDLARARRFALTL